MNPNSAYHLIPIAQGTDYTPTAQTTDFTDPNTGKAASPAIQVPNGVTPPIYAIMCTGTNSSTTSVQALGDAAPTNFPSGAFVQGVVYYIYLKRITALGGATFVGFQYAAQPLTF